MSQLAPPIKVLLVDDHPVVRAGLRALLEGFGGVHVVGEAADGAEALEMVTACSAANRPESRAYRCGGDGYRNAGPERYYHHAATASPGWSTGIDFDHLATRRIQGRGAGAKGYLLKDAEPEKLRQAILDTAAGKSTVSSEVAAHLMTGVQHPRETLSVREIELLKLMATGATNKQLAQSLFISEATVKTHLVHIYRKLNVTNRTAAINTARAQRLI